MANVEIWKDGRLMSRRPVDDELAVEGYWVTLKTGDRVLLKADEAVQLHGYRICLVKEERPPEKAAPSEAQDESDLLGAMARAVKQEQAGGPPVRRAHAMPATSPRAKGASPRFLGLTMPLWAWLVAGGGVVAAVVLAIVLTAHNKSGGQNAEVVAAPTAAPKPAEPPPIDEKPVAAATEKLSRAEKLFEQTGMAASGRVEDRGGKQLSELREQLSKAMGEVTEAERLLEARPTGWNNHAGFVKAVRGVQKAKELIPPVLAKVDGLLWPGPGGVPQMFPKVSPAIPLVEAIGRGSGSGFLVRHGSLYLVTNKHVVKGAREGFRLHFPLGDPGHPEDLVVEVPPANVEIVHSVSDLALINLDAAAKKEARLNTVHPLTLATFMDEPRTTDPVWIVGHPGLVPGALPELPNACNQGTVTNRAMLPPFGDCIQYDAAANPGNSGGPLLDRYGRVIGIVAIGMRDKALMNFALYVQTLQTLLDAPAANGLAKDRIMALLCPAQASEADLRAKYARLAAATKGFKPYAWTDTGNKPRFCVLEQEPEAIKINVESGKKYMVLVAAEADLGFAAVVVTGDAGVGDPSAATVVATGRKAPGAENFTLSFSAQAGATHALMIRKESGEPSAPLVVAVVRAE